MLSDQLRQLLTTYVDGELSNRQRRAVQRLLRRSPEARALLRKLQEDAKRIRALPRHRLGDVFTARVVRAAQQEQVRRRPVVRRSAFPIWAGFAAAAAVLIAVGVVSYLYFAQPAPQPTTEEPGSMARNDRQSSDPELPSGDGSHEKIDGGSTVVAIPPPKPPDRQNDPKPPELLPTPTVEKPNETPGVFAAPSETPLPDMEMFKTVVVKPPFSLLEKLHQTQADNLRKQLGQETALRLELPCADTAKGFRRMREALGEAGISLAIDAAAQNRLDKPRLRSNYVLVLEDVTAEELARVLAHLGKVDKTAVLKGKSDSQFSTIIGNRLSEADLKELAVVLRVDPHSLQPGTGTSKSSERLALAVTYNPERPKANSPEVKRYLESRKPGRAGALQVLLVLRETPR